MDLTFVSYPVVYEDIIMGIEWGMALSTVATILAFIVLAIMLRNIRSPSRLVAATPRPRRGHVCDMSAP